MKEMKKIHGVNLGNWLVLEYWMDNSLFDGIVSNTMDETIFSTLLDETQKIERLKAHRDHFITKNDFIWLAKHGLNSVRIPVPHWIFGDTKPYVGSIDYLDKAFDWANETGIDVLIDLHTAPGCQNGFDNGGIQGVTDWYKEAKNIDRTVEVIGELAKRYKDEPSLLGIQLLNEPTQTNPREIVRNYYLRGYDTCRKYIGEDKIIVIHDQFKLMDWKDFMREDYYKNVILDTHIYQCFGGEQALHPIDNLKIPLNEKYENIKEMNEYFPVIVGEWSVGLGNNEHFKSMSQYEKFLTTRAFADCQLLVYEQVAGWYFWSYKVLNDNLLTWNYRYMVENNMIPILCQ